MNEQQIKDFCISLLCPMSINKILIKVLGADNAIFLTELESYYKQTLIYDKEKIIDANWFYYNKTYMEKSCPLPPKIQTKCFNYLIKNGFILLRKKTQLEIDEYPKKCFSIQFEKIDNLLQNGEI
jgi:hypothetical protein